VPVPTASGSTAPPLLPFKGVVAATTCDGSVVPGSLFPGPTKTPSAKAALVTLHVPILEYHRVVPLADAGKSQPGLTMSPQVFDAQMMALHGAGWKTITLGVLADYIARGVHPPPNTFVVTVDDGWWDSYGYVYPILVKYGYVATFFVIAGRVGASSFMGPTEIRTLVQAGNEIGDHTANHVVLTKALPAALTSEIDSGAATIAAITGLWPQTLAYPRGKEDARVISAVTACKSIRMAVVEGSGGAEAWTSRFRVTRIQVAPYRQPADLLAQVKRVGR
jgi:peptidoglycan/xylan/chitin deacetylase (PgdA/CDA1 family)